MKGQTDLRIRKTYLALGNTLLEMLQEKDFEEITVNELCEQAMVGRGTFYKHFADKYEFLTFVVRERYTEFLKKMNVDKECESPTDYYLSLLRLCIDFCEQSPGLVSALRDSPSLFLLAKVVSEIVAPDITERLELDQKRGYAVVFTPQTIAPLICVSLMQTVLWWFGNREQISKEELMMQFTEIISRLCFRSN